MVMKKKLVGLFVRGFVCLSIITLFCPFAAAERGVTDDTIRVGVLSDRTGPCRDTIVPMLNGVESYFKWINSKGGVHGRKILVSQGDTQYKISKAAFEIKRLVNQEKVFMLCPGPENSGGYKVHPALFKELNVPVLSTVASKHVVIPPKKLLFEPSALRNWQVDVLFDYMMHDLKQKNATIGLVYSNNEYGHVALRAVQDRVKFYGIKNFVPVVLNFNETNAVTQVLKLKKAKVDVVFVAEIINVVAVFVKDAFAYGFHPIIAGATVETAIDSLVEMVANPKALEKYYSLHVYSAPYEDCPGSKEIRELAKTVPQAKKDLNSRWFSAGVVLAKIAVEGFQRAGKDLTVDSFVNSVESFRDFDTGGLHAPITFGPERRYGSTGVSLLKYDAETNRFKQITKVRTPRKTP